MPKKVNLKPLTVCNAECTAEAVRICKEPKKLVQEMTLHLFNLISAQLKEGTAEWIQIPKFGKFKTKTKLPRNGGTKPV
jgi:nucleoid DNA-binding protein